MNQEVIYDNLEKVQDQLGIKIIKKEYRTKTSDSLEKKYRLIDCLARETITNNLIAIEIKAGNGGNEAITQLNKYVSLINKDFPTENVQGWLIAKRFSGLVDKNINYIQCKDYEEGRQVISFLPLDHITLERKIEEWEQHRTFLYTYEDIAKLTGLTITTLRLYVLKGKFNPANLNSVLQFINSILHPKLVRSETQNERKEA